MSECRIVYGDAGAVYSPSLDRLTPGETEVITLDLSDDRDCQGAGVTITTATPSIATEDDDGLLTLGATVTDVLEIKQFVSVDPTQTQRMYELRWNVVLSDGTTIIRSVVQPVIPTRVSWRDAA